MTSIKRVIALRLLLELEQEPRLPKYATQLPKSCTPLWATEALLDGSRGQDSSLDRKGKRRVLLFVEQPFPLRYLDQVLWYGLQTPP
jgi:hypothetical protein